MSQTHSGPAYDAQIAALGRILQSLRDAQTAQEAINLALEHIQAEFDFEVSWLGLYDRLHHRLNTKGFHLPKGARFVRTHLPLTPGDILEQAVIQQRPLSIANIQVEPRAGEWGTLGKQLGLQSAVVFPIRRQDICFGILLLGSPRWGLSPTAGERSHLSLLTGFLAEALHQQEAEQQRLRAKRPEQSLLSLLETLNLQPGLDDRCHQVVREVQSFIGPACTRIFWLDSKGYEFWQRSSSQRSHLSGRGSVTIPIDQVKGFYQSLSNGQLIVVGEVHSSLKSAVTDKMIQLLKAASLMAAPIFSGGELQGFLSVEGSRPRIWSEAEKQFFQGVARLLSLALPVAEVHGQVEQMRAQQELTSGLVQGIYSDLDWRRILEGCSAKVCQQLSVQQFLVLIFDRDLGDYELCFQGQQGKIQGVAVTWPALDDVDWQMLERAEGAIAIEDTEHDLKLMAWRSLLQTLRANSLLACNVSPGNAPEGVVILTDHKKRRWTALESSLLESVSRQIGLILHQWQLQRQIDQQEHIYDSIQWGLQTLQQTFHLNELERSGGEHLAKLLQAPLVALATWQSGQTTAIVSQVVSRDKHFRVDQEWQIPLQGDAVLNWALQTNGILPLSLEDLPDISRRWIAGPAGSRLLIVALRTAPAHQSTGVLIVAAPPERRWSEYHLQVLALMANQLAWSRRHLELVATLAAQREGLEQLNWYKHHHLQSIHHLLTRQAQALQDLSLKDASDQGQRYQQIARQLLSLADDLTPVINDEQWQLSDRYHTIPLVSLLSRLLERVNERVQQQQLWIKVHNENSLIIGGDISKIEFVLYELMIAACRRSPTGGRIDIWCRPVDRNWLELSITDDGVLEPYLLAELQKGRPDDWLAPSDLDKPPGLHYAICQMLMNQMQSKLTLERLEDNRSLSRILLPIASNARRTSNFPRHRSQ
ncbi:histidine kinase [filamentous cyanobacterium CCP5]|nr:histidine kinase [filamentous cyanobacterium CCP5]